MTIDRPILVAVPFQKPTTDVIFHEYDGDDTEALIDKYFGDIHTYKIVGIECKNGKVVVYKNGTKLPRPLKNKKIFFDTYFIDAI